MKQRCEATNISFMIWPRVEENPLSATATKYRCFSKHVKLLEYSSTQVHRDVVWKYIFEYKSIMYGVS